MKVTIDSNQLAPRNATRGFLAKLRLKDTLVIKCNGSGEVLRLLSKVRYHLQTSNGSQQVATATTAQDADPAVVVQWLKREVN